MRPLEKSEEGRERDREDGEVRVYLGFVLC